MPWPSRCWAPRPGSLPRGRRGSAWRAWTTRSSTSGPATSERYRAALEAVAKDLEAKLATTRDPKVREDIQILIDSCRRQIATEKLEELAPPAVLQPGPHRVQRDLRPAGSARPEGAPGRGAGPAPPLRRARAGQHAHRRAGEGADRGAALRQEAPRPLPSRGGAGARRQPAARRRHRRAVQEGRPDRIRARAGEAARADGGVRPLGHRGDPPPGAHRQPAAARALRGLPPRLRGGPAARGRAAGGADRLRARSATR